MTPPPAVLGAATLGAATDGAATDGAVVGAAAGVVQPIRTISDPVIRLTLMIRDMCLALHARARYATRAQTPFPAAPRNRGPPSPHSVTGSPAFLPGPGPPLQEDGAEDDQALHDLLREGRDPKEVQEVVHGRDDCRADDRAANPALATEQARAADHDDRDRIELEAGALGRFGRGQPRDHDQRGDRGAQAADHVRAEDRAVRVDTRQAGGLAVVTDGIDPPPERREPQAEPGQQRDTREQQQGDRY